jgi:hypothetical protein
MMDYYYYDHETGMEHWHDGADHSEHCHDGVGLITRIWQTLPEFLDEYPNADCIIEG